MLITVVLAAEPARGTVRSHEFAGSPARDARITRSDTGGRFVAQSCGARLHRD
ncbi:MAG TPA: hypothetical protein VK020_06885 [Microlunatus sp.]|nr:hypothetical protein [Microlunatus sp.]